MEVHGDDEEPEVRGVHSQLSLIQIVQWRTVMNMRRNCLSKIPSRYIVDAMGQLPPCGPESTGQQLGVDLPIWGKFQVTFRPLKQAHNDRSLTWTWTATEATPVFAGKHREDRPSFVQ